MSFLHGVESQQLSKQGRTITVVKTAIIALVGTAPKGPLNTLTLVTNPEDAKQFGSMLANFTIPKALDAIFKQGAGTVLVVNVADASTAITAVTSESHVIASRKIKTTYHPVGVITTVKNSGGSTTYVAGTDYTADDFGNIKILNNALAEGVTLKVTYNKYDTTAVVASDIVGAIDGTTGVKTGCKLFADAYTQFGFKPKLILCPVYGELSTVATEILAMTVKYRAIGAIDAPEGTTVAGAITGRGPSGTIGFNTNDKRIMYLHPHLTAYDGEGVVENSPYSQWFMGVISAVDATEGYWVSPSNHQIQGVVGNEIPVSFDPSDTTSQANQLNANGIVTVINRFPEDQSVLKPFVWGNRSSLFPTSTDPITFMCGQRVLDIIDDSVDIASLPYVDKPINNATLDSIREEVLKFIRTLISRGALIDGTVFIDPAKNTPEQLAAGQFTLTKDLMFTTPMERIIHETFVDVTLLKTLAA